MEYDAPEIAAILGGPEILGEDVRSLSDLRHAIERGLPKRALEALSRAIFEDANRRRHFIHHVIPVATLKRRHALLTPAESEKTERIARIVAMADRVWKDRAKARRFLTAPHGLLEGKTPIEAASTDLGARQVEHILNSLEWGLPV